MSIGRATGKVSMARRDFLAHALWMPLLPLALSAWPAEGRAMARTGSHAPGERRSVRDSGAVGDGVHDDTDAFQRAIDRFGRAGGTLHVPAGTYAIDATRSVRLRSRVTLVMDARAMLVARPNALPRSYVLLVDDVEDVAIRGGNIRGERAGHLGSAGEWGHGISIHGARRVEISDIHVADCWGDGICIGSIFGRGRAMTVASDITLTRVLCTGNRRQGLSITSARRVQVIDSEFSGTGGTLPGCGIDVEPGTPRMGAEDVRIAGCRIHDNRGSGVQLMGNVQRLRMEHTTIRDNRGYGVLVAGVSAGSIEQNTIAGNGLVGALVRENVRDLRIVRNAFSGNSTRQVHQALKRIEGLLRDGSVPPDRRELQVRAGAQAVQVSDNTFAS